MQAFQYPEVYRDETAVSTALAAAARRCVAAAGPRRGGSLSRRPTRCSGGVGVGGVWVGCMCVFV